MYQFTAQLTSVDIIFKTHVIIFPDDVVKQLPAIRNLRLRGTINGHPFERALQNFADGRRFVLITKEFASKAGLTYNNYFEVKFEIGDQEYLEIPDELLEVLAQDEFASSKWEKVSLGRKRGLCHYIGSAKSVDVRINRSIDILRRVSAGEFDSKIKKKLN